jgi:hypothetical protein
MRFKLTLCGVALLVATVIAWTPGSLLAGECKAQASYVSAEQLDAGGFKQLAKFRVAAAPCTPACEGYINYSTKWADHLGVEATKSSGTSYTVTTTSGIPVGGGTTIDSTVLKVGACLEGTPCSVVGVDVSKVSCRRGDAKTCTVFGEYLDTAAGDPKGFKQNVRFGLQSADCGPSCEGFVTYTLRYKDKTGIVSSDSKTHKYTLMPSAMYIVQEVPKEVLLGSACMAAKPCKLRGIKVDKVSCRTP